MGFGVQMEFEIILLCRWEWGRCGIASIGTGDSPKRATAQHQQHWQPAPTERSNNGLQHA